MSARSSSHQNFTGRQRSSHSPRWPENLENNINSSEEMNKQYGDSDTKHTSQNASKHSVYGVRKMLLKEKIFAALKLYGSTPCTARQFTGNIQVSKSYAFIKAFLTALSWEKYGHSIFSPILWDPHKRSIWRLSNSTLNRSTAKEMRLHAHLLPDEL